MKRTASICLAISVTLVSLTPSLWARLRPRYGGTIRVETRGAAVEAASSAVTETLTSLDERGTVHPWLADRWQAENGERRWVFTLHARIAWQDGTALTGTAVAESLTTSVASPPWRTVRGTETQVIFESDAPMTNLPALLASRAYAIGRRAADGTPMGTGAYRIASMAGANATLDANDSYWRGRAYADHIEIYGSRALRSQWLDMNVGHAEIVEVPGEAIRRAQQERLRVTVNPDSELVLLVVSPEVRDVALRHALSLSIDRASLAGFVFQKQGTPAATLLPNAMTGYAPVFGSGYDVAAAKALRAQAPAAPAMTISYEPGDSAMQLAAERIALNAREAGLNLVAQPQGTTRSALRLMRVAMPSSDPSACLAELSRTLLGETVRGSAGIDGIFAQEKQLLDSYMLIPLAHLPAAKAYGEHVRQLDVRWNGANLADAWLEERR